MTSTWTHLMMTQKWTFPIWNNDNDKQDDDTEVDRDTFDDDTDVETDDDYDYDLVGGRHTGRTRVARQTKTESHVETV